MPSTDRKLELQAKDIDVSTVSQPAVCSGSGLRLRMFWNVTFCSLVEGYQHLGRLYGPNLQGSSESGRECDGSMLLQNGGNHILGNNVTSYKTIVLIFMVCHTN